MSRSTVFLDNKLHINELLYFIDTLPRFLKNPDRKNPNSPNLCHTLEKCIYNDSLVREIEQNIEEYCERASNSNFKINYQYLQNKICFEIVLNEKFKNTFEEYRIKHYIWDGSRKG